jgi:transcriptional regulator with PAS, ATPase and Fis domain
MFMHARREFERELVNRLIAKSESKMDAARRLGISYATLKTVVKDGRPAQDKASEQLVEFLRELVMEGIEGRPIDPKRVLELVRTEVKREFAGAFAALAAETTVRAVHVDAPTPAAGRTKRAPKRNGARKGVDHEQLVAALTRHKGNVRKVAGDLKVSHWHVYSLMRRAKIKTASFH